MMHSQLLTGKVEEQTNKKKQILQPFNTETILMEFLYDNILEKDRWVTEKGGGLKLVNQQKLMLKYCIEIYYENFEKNLFSGKGILNISLPVQIFNMDSNLQRICASMPTGPHFLESAAKTSDSLQRFKQTLAFGVSNSTIDFDVQKPFNPIVG